WSARGRPVRLEWSSDGARLLARGPVGLQVFDARGRVVAEDDPSDATHDADAAFVPGTHRVAVIRVHGAQSDLFDLATGRTLFRGAGRPLAARDLADGRSVGLRSRGGRTSHPGRRGNHPPARPGRPRGRLVLLTGLSSCRVRFGRGCAQGARPLAWPEATTSARVALVGFGFPKRSFARFGQVQGPGPTSCPKQPVGRAGAMPASALS